MTVIDEPAAAVAAGLCLAARSNDGVTTRHPRRCGWCDYPTVELARMVTGFNEWAGFDERRGTYARHDARVFAELPRDRQAALVLAAQAFEPLEQPTAVVAVEEAVPWL